MILAYIIIFIVFCALNISHKKEEPMKATPYNSKSRIYIDYCPYFSTTPDCIQQNCCCIASYKLENEDDK